jgi:hypothetical protein
MLLEWIQMQGFTLWLIAVVSLALFVGTLFAIPVFVRRIPVDYLTRAQPPSDRFHRSPSVGRFVSRIFKNLLGVMCITAGVVMLVLPGQGLITILVGIMLVDFPGKLRLERRFLLQPTVFRSINWMRAQVNQPALHVPERDVPARGKATPLPERDNFQL